MVFLFSVLLVWGYVLCLGSFLGSIFKGGLMIDYVFFVFGGMEFGFCFLFDYFSFGFWSSVSFISFLVFLYSLFYMSGDGGQRRFFWLVFLFVSSMFLLVFSGNFFLVLLGWDGLGLISFCLVIFYNSSSSLESGLITVFSNRVGDVFFLLSLFLFYLGMSWSGDFFSFFSVYSFFWLVLGGGITKSAQIPFSAWLPAAMAAPTPVSSLVHSSTLVTAGVYVFIRFNFLFGLISFVTFKVLFVFTMVLGGGIACLESDFKKVVAMSTLSQLGLMMFCISVGMWRFSFMHMVIHAFFKSMLFLSVGSLMASRGGCQDSRFYGGGLFEYSCGIFFVCSCFCLAGFPFLIGFYSKDFILGSSVYVSGYLLLWIFVLGCMFTVGYSFRLVKVSFLDSGTPLPLPSIMEGVFFVSFIFMLFLKNWLVGGTFYYLFLSEALIYFGYFDLFFGVILLVGGVCLFYTFRLFYSFFIFFIDMSFLKWMSSGGANAVLKNFVFYSYESSWMELGGGSGFYLFLFRFLNYFSTFSLIGLWSVFVLWVMILFF